MAGDGLAQRRHPGIARLRNCRCQLRNDLRRDQGFIALHVDDDGILFPACALTGDLPNPISARTVIRIGHHRCKASSGHHFTNALVIGGDDHLIGASEAGLLRNPHNHRRAANPQQGLARQTGGPVTGGDDHLEGAQSTPRRTKTECKRSSPEASISAATCKRQQCPKGTPRRLSFTASLSVQTTGAPSS